MSCRGRVLRGSVRSGNCPFGEMSVGKVSVGEVSGRETVLQSCTTRRRILRKKALTRCVWLISFYIRQYFVKIFMKKLSFLFLCKYVPSSSVRRCRYIRRIDIDNLKVYFVLFTSFTCIQCNFIYILSIIVLVDWTSCLDIVDPMGPWSWTSPERFQANIELKFRDDSVWLDRV